MGFGPDDPQQNLSHDSSRENRFVINQAAKFVLCPQSQAIFLFNDARPASGDFRRSAAVTEKFQGGQLFTGFGECDRHHVCLQLFQQSFHDSLLSVEFVTIQSKTWANTQI
jgi:hypothetical protein